jgi:hypothetical protein
MGRLGGMLASQLITSQGRVRQSAKAGDWCFQACEWVLAVEMTQGEA